MSSLLHDIRYALRLMARKPALVTLAVVSLGLGIGVNTAIFTLVNAVLLRDLPFTQPEEIVNVYTTGDDELEYSTSSVPDYFDYRDRNKVFSGLAAHRAYPLTWDSGDEPELVFAEVVSGNYFDVLGVTAVHGRTFLPHEDRTPGSHPVAVLAYDLWQSRFAGDRAVLGRTVKLNGHDFEIVGVAPETFHGTLAVFRSALWLPLMMHDQVTAESIIEERGSRTLLLKGRLRPGMTLEQAQAQLSVIAGGLAADYPETNEGRDVALVPASDVIVLPDFDGSVVTVATLLMVVVGLVLLIACSNIANLFLARASERRKEIAVRLSLGCGRWRLIRQLLTESVLISLIAGLGSLLFATWTARLLAGFQPPLPIPMSLDIGIDLRVFAFTLLVALVTGILCGLAPALHASRADLVPALKDEAAALGREYRRLGLRNILVLIQVTVSTLLLIGAGLFIRSLAGAASIDPGFTLRKGVVVTMMPRLGGRCTAAEEQVFLGRLLERARALPGVDSATLAEFLPLGLAASTREIYVDGAELSEGTEAPNVDNVAIGPDYFRTMGIDLLRGRGVTDHDVHGAPPVAIVNETAARRFWPDADPIGKRLRFSDAEDAKVYEVIGLARDGRYRTLGESPRPYIYTSQAQQESFILTLIVAASAEAESRALVRRLLDDMDQNLPIIEIKTMSEHLEIMLFLPRMGAALLAGMGLLGLTLAAVGIYSVVACAVARRTHEVGVRMALGAGRTGVLRMLIREGMNLVFVGAGLGIVLALVVTRALAGILYGVSSNDPVTYVAVTIFMLTVALLANFVPANRATTIDPMQALRYE
jgi:predicted permease